MLREPLAIPLREARPPLVLAIAVTARLRAGMERQRQLEEALAPLMS